MVPSTLASRLPMLGVRRRRVALTAAGAAFLVIGVAGETLPGASAGRVVPVEWWNYVTLVLDSILIGLIAATYADGRDPDPGGRGKAATGAAGFVGTAAIACPACSPLAIPLFGSAGVLSFLAPQRALIALLSVALLAVTLAVRMRAARTCRIPLEET